MRNPTESQIDEQGEMGRECNFIMSLSAQLGEEEGWREEGGRREMKDEKQSTLISFLVSLASE